MQRKRENTTVRDGMMVHASMDNEVLAACCLARWRSLAQQEIKCSVLMLSPEAPRSSRPQGRRKEHVCNKQEVA
ncbi:hypothetical protein MHYP_G00225310 [Metynnis hypsauchen]